MTGRQFLAGVLCLGVAAVLIWQGVAHDAWLIVALGGWSARSGLACWEKR